MEDDLLEFQNLDPMLEKMPNPVAKAFIKYASSSVVSPNGHHDPTPPLSSVSPKLLPIQQKSYQIIARGEDAVLFSPTGTGKTLAYVLPLAARLYEWKHDGSLQHQKAAQKKHFQRRQFHKNNSFSTGEGDIDTAAPSILVVEPSRELARQVGKVWGKFHPTATKTSRRQVVTVYGGVPMQRHAAMLSSKTDVVIGSEFLPSLFFCTLLSSGFLTLLIQSTMTAPGRLRELIREKYLSTSHVRSMVLDEADTLLDFKDNPEVDLLLEGMENDYQLVLASATVNRRVERFVGGVMELEVGEPGYVVVDDRGDAGAARNDDGRAASSSGSDRESTEADADGEPVVARKTSPGKIPAVHHWSMAASAASRLALTSDLIVTIAPRRGIIFVQSKAEVERVAQELKERLAAANDVSVYILHGDMIQAARSRTVYALSGDTSRMTRVLVATDVAARGIDLPAVDLVVQYGVPRKNGKDGTFDAELYIHRTGRAGRFGNTREADSILLFDRFQGEASTLSKLQREMEAMKGIAIVPRQLPSPSDVMKASYDRAFRRCEEFGNRENSQSLVQYFIDGLSRDLHSSGGNEMTTSDRERLLLQRCATAMAALSGLEEAVPPRSLLTADPRDRTVRVWNNSSEPLTPPEVTKLVKALGSGKLGRISICSDGSAVFDLGAKRAERLLKKVSSDADLSSAGWRFEMSSSLSTMPL